MSCTPPSETEGGVLISASPFENARDLLAPGNNGEPPISGDNGDPTLDEYEENIANGNNEFGTKGVQFPPPAQTTLPEEIKDKPKEENNNKPVPKAGDPIPCDKVDTSGLYGPGGSINYDMPLRSTDGRDSGLTLRDFTVGAKFKHSIKDDPQILSKICNMTNLAYNVVRPLQEKYGKENIMITSGLRNSNSSTSQHNIGQAVDIQFRNSNYETDWERAQWIKDNVPYDQYIFEHSSTSGRAWNHLSYNPNGNRPSGERTKVMTMHNNNYSPGLKKMF